MSQPDQDQIVGQIRSAQIAASPELRARVRAISAESPAAPTASPRRRELPWRRTFLVLAPATVAVALASTLAVGLLDSGGSSSDRARQAAKPVATLAFTEPASDTVAPTSLEKAGVSSGGAGGSAGSPPATPGRAQLYDAELTLKIKDLSTATKKALRLTRDFHGYVRSVDYGSGT